ncbi:MAG TPA: hypothetical protein VLV31_01620 [Candidatus Acidoferrales bacterium]|nr:hypothetical protein [Candidatus Acidoferrales bacterium]
MRTGRGWTWGAPKTGRFTHNPSSPSQNTAFPFQILVYMEEFFMDLEKHGMEKRTSADIGVRKSSGAMLQDASLSS